MDVEKIYDLIVNRNIFFSNQSEWYEPYGSTSFDADSSVLGFVKSTVYCSFFTNKSVKEAAWIMYSNYKNGLTTRSIELKLDIKLLLSILHKWIKTYSEMLIKIPSHEKHDSIVFVLSSLDNKINLLNCKNHTQEPMTSS